MKDNIIHHLIQYFGDEYRFFYKSHNEIEIILDESNALIQLKSVSR